jgi:murein L,D-transpeptidase YcbB/YkuD
MRTLYRSVTLILLLLCLVPAHALEPTAEQIRKFSEAILDGSDRSIGGQQIAATTLLPSFYAGRDFQPVWLEKERLRELLRVLESAEEHGLNPEDYHYPTLAGWPESTDPMQLAARDVLATEALIRFGYHLHFGKIDAASLDPDWNLTRRLQNEEPVAVLEQAVAAPKLDIFLTTRLEPDGTFYAGLRAGLARYREIAAAGGWPMVPEGPTLRPGDRDPRVAAVRARLAVTDGAADQGSDSQWFDPDLASAVEHFQARHGLDADGIIGARTVEAMNVPVASRIDQLKANLERTRWVFRDLEPRFLIVNIAGFEAYVIADGKVTWKSRVQVGKPYRKTPVFKKKMTYLVLGPTWTVPPTILREDIIPKIKKDPGYLARKDMVLLDRSGKLVDISKVDLTAISADNFPYTVRQEPGPKNALGRIKFMFPNQHFVYLHDTPSQTLFDRAERTTSSGCIRVEKPISLAAELLGDPTEWSETRVEERISKASNETVTLTDPIMVFLMYWTSVPDDNGDVKFFSDVYSRDQAVLDGLQQPFRFSAFR